MYLKRLDIEGFKSFPTQAVFDFGPGITAIVGPNGCGKSNVADALRWVLGEQSGKLLRARKLEDVIFAGSSRLQPNQTAEATISLDNSDGWLPLDAHEVRITRRGYRSGESAYLINRRRARLRDISELFLRARAGQSSYAIMGQGLVESILNFRPEERRLLLEEAADLQGLRMQLEEALQHLSSTQENMERVGLLLKEIAPNLSQFERHARRASQRANLETELRHSLRAWYEDAWQRAQDALVRAQMDLEVAEEHRSAAEAKYEESGQRLAEVHRLLSERGSGELQRARLADRVRERHDRLQEALALEQRHYALLSGRGEELRNELAEVKAQRERLAKALQEAESRVSELDSALEGRLDLVATLERELAAAENELATRRYQMEVAERAYAEAKTALAATQSRLEGWHEALRWRQEASPALAFDLTVATAQLVSLAREYADLRTRERSREAELETRLAQRQSLERVLDEQRVSLESHRERLQDITSQLERAQGQLEALQEDPRPLLPSPRRSQSSLPAVPEPRQVPAVPSEVSSPLWRLVLNALARLFGRADERALVHIDTERISEALTVGELPSGMATLVDVIQVPAGLERAIAAALADRAEALIVANRQDALAAAELILHQNKTRTILLPLRDIQPIYPPNLLRESGVIGIAANVVRCAQEYRSLINALLGRVIIVEDTDTAQRVLRRGLGSVVTREGILFHQSGLIESGRGSVAIQQRRDLNTLPRRIRRLEQEKARLDMEVASLSATVLQGTHDLEELYRHIETLTGQERELRSKVAQCRQAIGRSQGEIRRILATQKGSALVKGPSDYEKTSLERELHRLEAAVVTGEEAAWRQRAALKSSQERRDALSHEVTVAKAEAANLEHQQASLESALNGYKDNLFSIDGQIAQKEPLLRALTAESSGLEDKLRRRQEALARLAWWILEFQTKGIPQRPHKDSEEREKILLEAEADLALAHSELLSAERERAAAEAAVKRGQDEVSTLKRQIEYDGFAISAEDEIFPLGDYKVTIPQWLASPRPSIATEEDLDNLWKHIEQLRSELGSLGGVNPQAEEDYSQIKERHDFLISQMADLEGAERTLLRAIADLEGEMRERFQATFQQVGDEFRRYFVTFFGGGSAKLILTASEDYRSSGVDIIAQPPGKRLQSLSALSGGEKALTAIALLFALLQTRPSPFCVLDEVDAALDDTNVGRFVEALRELSQRTQFILVTHNRRTMEAADRIYGMTMSSDGASKILSLQLADLPVG